MTNHNDVEQDPKLRTIESQLRQLRPRAAKLDLSGIATPTHLPPRNLIWSYAFTWVCGVAVGCLAMTALRMSPMASPKSASVSSPFELEQTLKTKVAQQNSVTEPLPETHKRGSFSNFGVQRIESIVEVQAIQRRLLVGSHLNETLTLEPPPPAMIPRVAYDEPRGTIPSTPKTRRELMLELLDNQYL